MPELGVDGVTLAYDVVGEGDPVLLVCGCGQPAVSWSLGVAPALVDAGYQVITFDNRGMEPSSSPPPPYSIDDMATDALALMDHLGLARVHVVGYSMGGWIAETLAWRHPERIRSAAFLGSCNRATSWELAITAVEVELARKDHDLSPLFFATETMRYLPNHELQDDGVVDAWVSLLGDLEPWANPGRLGQYQAALAWSSDTDRVQRWPDYSVPSLILAFEHDVDSPPVRAREAAAAIPGSQYVELPGASHLGPMTHAAEVGAALVEFLGRH